MNKGKYILFGSTVVIAIILIYVFAKIGDNYEREYHENGALKSKYKLVEGEVSGEVFLYDQDGSLKSVANFKNGIQHGKAEFYYKSGNTERIIYFDEGVQTDSLKAYYENGQLQEVSFVQNDKKHGDYKEFHENGKLKYSGQFEEGLKVGQWLEYNDQEQIIFNELYVNGKQVSVYDNVRNLYTNRVNDYELKVSDKWPIQDQSANSIIFGYRLSSGITESFNIIVRQNLKRELDSFIEIELQGIKKLSEAFRILERTDNVFSGHEARQIKYKINYNDLDMHVYAVFLKKDESIISLTYMTNEHVFEENFEQAKELLSSFKFVDEDLI